MNTIASRLSTLEAALDQLRRGTGGADGPRTLTQILDLVVLCDREREATAMRKVLAKLPANRPSRALIALAQREPRETEAEASLVEYAGGSSDAPKLASEVVQLVSGDGGVALPAAIAGLLLPDLPVYLLLRLDPSRWPGLVDGVWPLASRIVVDSTHEASALMTVPELIARPPRVPVTDLSWTKLTGWRDTVARLFDDPRGARSLDKLTRLVETEKILRNAIIDAALLRRASDVAVSEVSLTGDVRGSVPYKEELLKVYTSRGIRMSAEEKAAP